MKLKIRRDQLQNAGKETFLTRDITYLFVQRFQTRKQLMFFQNKF